MIYYKYQINKYGNKGNCEMAEKDCLKSVESYDKTGFNYTMSLITGKYKLTVLYAIYRHEIIKFNELQRYLNIISHKTLSNTLKELEKDNLIIKKDYKEIPPRVEYSLSDKGKSFIPILYAMCDWGEKFIK